MPKPFNPSGIFEYRNLKRIAAIVTIAKAKPTPELNPNTTDSGKSYALSLIKIEAPKIEQFTVISGKNIPSELYKDGLNLSINISTN